MGDVTHRLDELLREVRACRLCAAELPLGPRPVLRAAPSARILVVGQAPGTAVHASGVPFDDPSGVRLRDWMGVDEDAFYDEERIAIVPMGFCYPGRGKSGDLPPKRRCARTWREPLLAQLPDITLTLLFGQYALAWHLPEARGLSLTETVRRHAAWGDHVLPMPHPSPRNNLWLARNPWFEAEVVPVLRRRVRAALAPTSSMR
ncbi:MAG: uracil-DNA glycosylase family protein [Xanthomonadales bacterium]|nr:uracil-DNA glycosylase family protein [Xanthomonadales bacterium]